MRIWGLRTRPSSRDLLNEAAANSRAALEEASAARRAAESLQAELRGRLADNENHKRRAVRVALLTLVLLALSAWLILRGAAGLGDPSADARTFGSIGVAVEMDGPPAHRLALPFEKAPTFGVAGTFLPDGDTAFYDVFFPREFVGKRFALLLEDGAILREITEGTERTPPAVACRESGGSAEIAYSIDHRCQIISGTVPEPPSLDGLLRSLIAPESCIIDQLPLQFTMAHVRIWGTLETQIVDHLDWAHANLTLPGLGSGISNRALNHWNGIALDRWYGTGLQAACRVSKIPFDSKVTDSNPSDLTVSHYSLGWYHDDALLAGSVATKQRGAEATGTILASIHGSDSW